MKIYLKKGQDNEIANHNFYAAYDGFKQMGFEICYFQDVNELSDHQKEDIVVSYVDDVRTMLRKYDIVAPEMDYPDELAVFLGRKVWKSKLSVIANNPEKWNVFIKPIEDKKFTGVVVRGTKDLMGCGTYGEDPEILCSDVVKFVSDKGETLLIEVNDGYALGHYGLFSLDYAKLLSARWSELTDTTDECAF